MSNLNDNERLHLDKMIKEYDAEDNTSKIRELRHSVKIRDNVERLLNLKKKYQRMQLTDKKKFETLVISHCNFLWNNYTNIFNRLMKDEMDIKILYTFNILGINFSSNNGRGICVWNGCWYYL